MNKTSYNYTQFTHLLSNLHLVVGAGLYDTLGGEKLEVKVHQRTESTNHADGGVGVTAESMEGLGERLLLSRHLPGGINTSVPVHFITMP